MPELPVAMVTGGSRGIGAAVVNQLLRQGYSVCFTYLEDDEAARRVVVEGSSVGTVRAVRADVIDTAATGRAFDVAASMGRLTVLVNNAGITGRLSAFVDVPDEEVHRVVGVNLVAPLLLCRDAVQRWAPDPEGRSIVNVSSVAASLGAPGEYIPYAAAKAGLETLTVGLAKEVASMGIRVNAVAVGTTQTDIHGVAGDPGRPARVASRIPMGRVAHPPEVAAAVAWLAGPEASYVTGAVLRVAGGL